MRFRIQIKSYILIMAFNLIFGIINIYGQPKMDIKQTLSDGAQKYTIAFSGLAFLTGEEESYTFLPPGKLSDYFGFQYLRDNDPDQMGHNTDFVTKSANNLLALLSENQKGEIIALAKSQVKLINDYGYARFPLIRAFHRLLIKDFPGGSTGLDSAEVVKYSASLFRIDGIISFQRAKLFGKIIRSLSKEQRDSLDKLASSGMKDWPMLEDQIDKKSLSHDEHVAVMTYASEMFGWYAGSVEADVYFCPERQATYFGGFYMKDIPAMGNPNYTIDANITANKGKALLDALDPFQRNLIEGIVELQKPTLYKIVDKREEISNQLRGFWKDENVDSLLVIKLSEEYGEMDGMLAYWYSTRFAQVGWTLTDEQKDSLFTLRNLKDYPATKPFLFSEKIDWPQIINTDFFFNSSTQVDATSGLPEISLDIKPNQSQNSLLITINSQKSVDFNLTIYDIRGNELDKRIGFADESYNFQINFDIKNCYSGIYFFILKAENTLIFKKYIILR